MPLVKLTFATAGDPPIHINPLQVVAVRTMGQNTAVFVAVAGKDGGLQHISVRETVDVTVTRLNMVG